MLLELLRKDNVAGYEENGKTFSTPTGFTAIDILGGTLEFDENYEPYIVDGIPNKFAQQTGHSGSGKTTLVLQMLASCVDWWNSRYPNIEPSDLIFFDAEDNTTIHRFQELSGWDSGYLTKHFSLQKTVDLKEIYDCIMRIVDFKQKNKDKLYMTLPIRDIDGNLVKSWASTYIVIDSIAAVKSKVGLSSLDRNKEGELKQVEQIVGNIDAMQEAREMVGFITKIKPMLNQYGIALITINHIVQSPQMGMFDFPKRILMSLKPGEKLRGGTELVYQSYAISFVKGKEKLDEKNPVYGDIFGSVNEFAYIKSKNHGENVFFRFVFNPRKGYLPELSDFEYLYSNSFGLGGSPASMYLTIIPELKFTRKNLYHKCHENPLLARALQFTAKLRMLYTIVLDQEVPDITKFAELPYPQRISLIWNLTDRYPGYGAESLDEEFSNMLVIGNSLNNIQKDYSSSVLTHLMMEFMTPRQPGEVPMVPYGNGYFHKSLLDPTSFMTIKDGENEYLLPNNE
jgi:RecA/RadA recombinase